MFLMKVIVALILKVCIQNINWIVIYLFTYLALKGAI